MKQDPELPDDIVDLLPLWIGGDLVQADADRVSAAVADSDALSERAGELATARAALIDGLATAIELEPAPDLWPGVRAELALEGLITPLDSPLEAAAEGRGKLLFFGHRSRVVRIAGAAAVLLTGGLLTAGLLARTYFDHVPGDGGGSIPAAALGGGVASLGSAPDVEFEPVWNADAAVESVPVMLAAEREVDLHPVGIQLLGTNGRSILERNTQVGVHRIPVVFPGQNRGAGAQLASEVR